MIESPDDVAEHAAEAGSAGSPSPDGRRLTMTFYAAIVGHRPEIDPTLPADRVPCGPRGPVARRVREVCQRVAGEATADWLGVTTHAAVRRIERKVGDARRLVGAER